MSERVKTVPGTDPAADALKKRRERLAIAVVGTIIALLTLVEARLATVGGAVGFTSNVVIFALINLNVILIVLLIFLVTRNLFRIILDRRRNILGARIRSRLVLIFIGFSLFPTILLFIAATNITTSGIKSWIGGRVGAALTGALDLARRNLEAEGRTMGEYAERASRDLREAVPPERARAVLVKSLRGAGPGSVMILLSPGGAVVRTGEIPQKTSEEILSRLKGGSSREGRGESATLVGETYAAAARPLPGGRYVVAVRLLSPADSRIVRDIAKAYDEYHQARLLDDPIRASYVGILILITLLIVFSASWMGIYLAKLITVPVQLLAEGTEKVAGGDLDVSLEYRSDDEFGHLVSSFNRMTADLRQMKANLQEANVSLTTTYEELRLRTQFIETILTNITTGVVVIDRAGRVMMINRVAERILGIPKEPSIGRQYRDVFAEGHYRAIRALSRELGESRSGDVERQIVLPVDGKEISLRVSLSALRDPSGEYTAMVVAFDDLSQAMRLQRVLAWREVARRIAHEIRNPLTPIRLSAERMRKRFGTAHADDPAFEECARTILSEVSSLANLVEEFSRFARMPDVTLKEGDVAAEIRPVVETFRAAHPGLRWEFDGGDVPPAFFDAPSLRRAVTNILANAAAVAAGAVSVTCAHDGALGLVRIVVADDGPGVLPADRERIFEPYFSRREGGTGLGLAIASAIASDHGGTVSVRDNVPRGAVFVIEFPVRRNREG